MEPTPEFLAAAVTRSTRQAHSLEVAVAMQFSGAGLQAGVDVPALTGRQDGDMYAYRVDMLPWFEEMAKDDPSSAASAEAAPAGDDLTMDLVGDSRTLFVRGPLFSWLRENSSYSQGDGTSIGTLIDLGDGWGRADLTAIEEFSLDALQLRLGAAVGGSGAGPGYPGGTDPQEYLDALANVHQVTSLGADSLDGIEVKGLAVRFTDAAAEIPTEVWLDGAGYIRRIIGVIDLVALQGGPSAAGVDEFVVTTTIDLHDYDRDVRAIELPADAVDVTAAIEAAQRESEQLAT